jgi:pyruvate dehydrogenase E2 component (dihydrolipoamide acetyltransferase)
VTAETKTAEAQPDSEAVLASPVARRMATELGLNLRTVTGTGPGGRIVRSDVEAAAKDAGRSAPPKAPATPTAPATSTTPAASEPKARSRGADTAKGDTEVVELSRIQQVIARRMAEAKATVPEFTLVSEVVMDRCLSLRAELKEIPGRRPPSLNDMVVKACALALREHPRANGSYRDGRWDLYSRVNVGVAVASLDALLVPTVFDADLKPLEQIATETANLAERARSGAIEPPELAGGTFTVSNLGMFGVRSFTAVINPPQAGILAVGATVERIRILNGEQQVRSVMELTLTCDHRILYGADAAKFLGRVRELLESPAALQLAPA